MKSRSEVVVSVPSHPLQPFEGGFPSLNEVVLFFVNQKGQFTGNISIFLFLFCHCDSFGGKNRLLHCCCPKVEENVRGKKNGFRDPSFLI